MLYYNKATSILWWRQWISSQT